MKISTLLLGILGTFVLTTVTHASISQSKSYKLTVTVPASVGISSHPHTVWPVLKAQNLTRQELQIEEVERNNEIVVLKSYVVK